MLDRLGSSHLRIGQCADMWTQSQVSAHPLGNTATSFPGFYNHPYGARETGRRENLGSRLGNTLV